MSSSGTIHTLPTETYFAVIRQTLSETGQAYVRVTGTSMMPLLRHLKDGVIIVPPEDVRRGDIVLFDRRNGRYALHRVIRMKTNGFTMAGDHQWYADYDLPYEQIVGRVERIDRGGHWIERKNFFLRMYGFLVTAACLPRINLRRAVAKIFRLFRHPLD